ncbi:MAG: MogA/MoaB family molybdenum cofactor biosynthesis protein [Longimicrobiaceae bacterium]
MTSESSAKHRAAARERGPVTVAVVTVSDSRTPENDESGAFLLERIEAAGHRVAGYRLVPDEPEEVSRALDEFSRNQVRVILFNGGTGVSSRDRTFDVLERELEKRLPGFGELFRWLSYRQVGAAAMLSRAVAGVYRGRLVVSLPGSPAAVRLAWEELLEPELEHLVWEIGR